MGKRTIFPGVQSLRLLEDAHRDHSILDWVRLHLPFNGIGTLPIALGPSRHLHQLSPGAHDALIGAATATAAAIIPHAIITGTDDSDRLDGTDGNDTIYGLDGGDIIQANGGDDVIYAGDSNNSLLTDDTILDGPGNDTVYGEGGHDDIIASAGDDYYDGGTGGVNQGNEIDTVFYTDAATAGIVVDMRLASGQVHSAATGDAANIGVDTLVNIEQIYGSNYDDVITAGDTGMALYGKGGNDIITGSAADDNLEGGDGNDVLDGGGGFDMALYDTPTAGVHVSLEINGPQDTIGAGIDTLTNIEGLSGTSFDDILIGNDGTNRLADGGGNDILIGNGGNDMLEWSGGVSDDLVGGTGNDNIYTAPTYKDTIEFAVGDGQDTVHFIEATDDVRIYGYASAQSITQSGAAVVVVFSATDQITFYNTTVTTVESALHFIVGTDGNDMLSGGAGNDPLSGGGGDDALSGNMGQDVLDGGAGNDALDGGDGTDTATYADAASAVTVNLGYGAAQNTVGAGTDTLTNIENLTGSSFDDTLLGNSVANALSGGDGNDTLSGGGGNDTLDGGAGIDTASYATSGSGVTVSLANTAAQNTGAPGMDTLTSIENLTGSAYADNLTGNGVANTLSGGTGADRLTGNGGNDTLDGGAGNDVLDGGVGADAMRGGTGNDTYWVDNASDAITENANEGTDTVHSTVTWTLGSNVENLILAGSAAIDGTGNALANSITGNAGDNHLSGLDGNDMLSGLGGNDTIDGGIGADHLLGGDGNDSLTGGGDNDLLEGGAGADSMLGGSGNDTLKGGAGNDILDGGAGRDVLNGGTGADQFVFHDGDFGSTNATADVVYSFSSAEADKVDLHGVDANTLLGGDQAFSFIGTDGFHNVAGELRYQEVGGNTYVYADLDGDGHSDLAIMLGGTHALTSGDFIL